MPVAPLEFLTKGSSASDHEAFDALFFEKLPQLFCTGCPVDKHHELGVRDLACSGPADSTSTSVFGKDLENLFVYDRLRITTRNIDAFKLKAWGETVNIRRK